MLDQKQGQFWNPHRKSLTKLRIPDFRFLLFFISSFFSGLKKSNCNFYSKISLIKKKNKTKIKNRDPKFCAEFDADSKTVLVFFSSIDSF